MRQNDLLQSNARGKVNGLKMEIIDRQEIIHGVEILRGIWLNTVMRGTDILLTSDYFKTLKPTPTPTSKPAVPGDK